MFPAELFVQARERILGLQYPEERAEAYFALAAVSGEKGDFDEGKKILDSLDYLSPSTAVAYVEALLTFGNIQGAREVAAGIREFYWRVTALLKVVAATREKDDIDKVVSELEQSCGCDGSYKPKFFLELARVSGNKSFIERATVLMSRWDIKRWLEFLFEAARLHKELSVGE